MAAAFSPVQILVVVSFGSLVRLKLFTHHQESYLAKVRLFCLAPRGLAVTLQPVSDRYLAIPSADLMMDECWSEVWWCLLKEDAMKKIDLVYKRRYECQVI